MSRTRIITSVCLSCGVLLGGIGPMEGTAQQVLPPDLEVVLARLEQNMGDLRTVETNFTQEKNLKVFDQTMVLKGKAYMQKPDLLAWKVAEPMLYSLVITGNTIRQWDEDTNDVQEISLEGQPGFEAAIEQMQLWFSGEARALLPNFEARLLQQDPVVLEFLAREGNLAAEAIISVRLEFREDETYIRRITMNETSGDSMILTFSDVRINEPIDPAAWEARPRAR